MANNELQMPTAKKYKMPFKSITKRDGTLADFDGDKIYFVQSDSVNCYLQPIK